MWNSKPTRGTIQSDTKLSSATKGTIQSDTNFQVLYLRKKNNNNNNQHKKQYKVIQKKNFQVPQKKQYKVLQIFKCYFYKKNNKVKKKIIAHTKKRTSKKMNYK